MQLRDRSGEPPFEQRAVYNPSATLDKYRREINDAVKHWQSEQARANKTDSAALLSMSSTILGELNERRTWTKAGQHVERPGNRLVMEVARRRVLSALSISMLLRAEWEESPAAVPTLVGSQGELGTVLDIVIDKSPEPQRGNESRVHTPAAVENALPDTANEQWYKHGDLWSCQVRPAEPTDYLVEEFLPRLGIVKPDFTHHETIYPYVAAR